MSATFYHYTRYLTPPVLDALIQAYSGGEPVALSPEDEAQLQLFVEGHQLRDKPLEMIKRLEAEGGDGSRTYNRNPEHVRAFTKPDGVYEDNDYFVWICPTDFYSDHRRTNHDALRTIIWGRKIREKDAESYIEWALEQAWQGLSDDEAHAFATHVRSLSTYKEKRDAIKQFEREREPREGDGDVGRVGDEDQGE